MIVQITENPGYNSYIGSLIEAYKIAGHTVVCGPNNFFYSNLVPDVLHIHWPERLYRWFVMRKKDEELQYEWIKERLNWYKNNNTKIIHTIHNLMPHFSNGSFNDRKFYRLFIDNADILSHHCPKSIDLLKDEYIETNHKLNLVNHHGDYLLDYKYIDKIEARKKLNLPLDKFIILNFGSQQKYKGLSFLEKVFNSLDLEDKYLLTAGNPYIGQLSKIKQVITGVKNKAVEKINLSNKKYLLRSIELDELQLIFNAADILFTGYGRGLNSGVLSLAATFKLPVVMPKIGCFEYQLMGWKYYSYERMNLEQAKQAITMLYKEFTNTGIKLDNTEYLRLNSWDLHVENILNRLKENAI